MRVPRGCSMGSEQGLYALTELTCSWRVSREYTVPPLSRKEPQVVVWGANEIVVQAVVEEFEMLGAIIESFGWLVACALQPIM